MEELAKGQEGVSLSLSTVSRHSDTEQPERAGGMVDTTAIGRFYFSVAKKRLRVWVESVGRDLGVT